MGFNTFPELSDSLELPDISELPEFPEPSEFPGTPRLLDTSIAPDIPDRIIGRFEMASGLVYALPAELLDTLKCELSNVLSTQIFLDECELSAVAKQFGCVAFRCCQPVRFPRLARPIKPVTARDIASAEVACENPEVQSSELTDYLKNAHRYSLGYCGWLVQQRNFRSEIGSLRETHGEAFGQTIQGLPPLRLIHGVTEHADEGVQCVMAIYRKWRLQHLVTIDLPVPNEPQMAASNTFAHRVAEGGVFPNIPDIFPIDGTGPIVKQMEYARINLHAPHLKEWKTLIGSVSRQKKLVDTYARQFEFQHYFRVIRQRYPDQLRRKKGALCQAFASYFDVSKYAIDRDASKLDDLLDHPLHAML